MNNVKLQFFDIDFSDIGMIDFNDYDIIIDAIFGIGIMKQIILL